MLVWSMHTSPDLSRPHKKKSSPPPPPKKQFLVVNFKYSQSPILTSSSADILLGCKGRKQPLPLLVIAKVWCTLCKGSAATRRRPLRFRHVATQWKSSWKGCAINLLATSGWVTREAPTGLYLICGPPSNHRQVWDFQKSLSDSAAQTPLPFNEICAPKSLM